MTEIDEKDLEPLVFEDRWEIPFRYSAGRVTQQFFHRLRDEGVISGSPCPECARVLVPPRSFCERCFVPTSELVPIGTEGVLQTYSVVTASFEGLPDPPYVVAYVQLDGSSTSLVNFLHGVDLNDPVAAAESIVIGSRVRVIVEEARHGRMTDFHFELVADSSPGHDVR